MEQTSLELSQECQLQYAKAMVGLDAEPRGLELTMDTVPRYTGVSDDELCPSNVVGWCADTFCHTENDVWTTNRRYGIRHTPGSSFQKY
jgi:hypothetical protein